MPTNRLVVDVDFTVGDVDRRLFGSFVEHMGRSVYTGIFEPGHPGADADGMRTDVLELTRELGVSVVRYPGGNFVSGYRWEDGVGPVEKRPTRLDLAWKSIETNRFGLHEFINWAGKADVEPMLAVNLGTRGIQEAADLVEYANHPGGTELSDRRIANGATTPFGVKLWCLGNEADGPWQIGHMTAFEYGRLAAETGKAMKLVDPSIQLVACGSSGRAMPTFGRWESEVLEHTYDVVDYISLHAYYEEHDGDTASFLASSVDMDAFIDEVVATCDHVGAVKRSRKKLKLSFDEWNVWSQTAFHAESERGWENAPRLIEDTYTVTDAVVVGSYLISLVNHADRIGVACQAQLANVIAPIRSEPTGPAWRQTVFHPFALMSANARGTALRVEQRGATVATERYGEVPAVCAAATFDNATGRLAVFLANRDVVNTQQVSIDLRGMPAGSTIAEHRQIADADPRATNTAEQPDRVVPAAGDASLVDGVLTLSVPPVSFHSVIVSAQSA